MSLRMLRLALLVGLLCTSVARAAGDDSLAAAYGEILRGDWATGQATLERVLEHGPDQRAERAHNWVKAYQDALAVRKELKAQTFEWNIAQSQQALADGTPFLALSFAAQAVPYAADLKDLQRFPWVADLTAQAKAEAAKKEQEGRWTNTLSYYGLLARIYPEDKELKELSERAGRHARIDWTYKDKKAVDERTRGVDKGLFRQSLKLIAQLYYREPDFAAMAEGALDNLLVFCEAKKPQAYLDGLGNPALRDHFTKKLRELRGDLAHGEHGTASKDYSDKDLQRLFNRVLDVNRESIELPEGLVVAEFMQGALDKLDDYTSMIWPADSSDFDKMMMGGFEGIGIQLQLDERTNRLKVVTPLENSPALEAGIQPDDLIMAVNGETTAGWTTEDAVNKIMGPAGTDVILTIRRPATDEEVPYRLVRRKIVLTTVHGVGRVPAEGGKWAWDYMLDKDLGVAYAKLTNFHPDSARELHESLKQAHTQGMRALILDARANPGGLLETAIDIVSLFVDEGEVVSTQGRLEAPRHEKVTGKAPFKDLPLVVLVNEGSASASEILAGALQDHHRAIIVGDRTFGKGSVQHVRPIGDQAARLKLTTALYYLPSGRSPHKDPNAARWGVDPDWDLKLTPKELRRVFEREREMNVIHNETRSTENKPLSAEEQAEVLEQVKAADTEPDEEEATLLDPAAIKRLDADPNKAPVTDPQLEAALLLVRVKLAADLPWPREFVVSAER